MRNLNLKNQKGRSLLPESGADAPIVLSAVYTDSTPAKNRQADVPQYGRSMIEMLGVLAIIGVLSVGGIAGYSKAMTKYRINKTIEQITLIAGNVRAFFAPQRNYDGLSSYGTGQAIIKKAKLVPDEMWDGNNIKNVWGNSVSLGAESKSSDGDYKAFAITYPIPKEYDICIEILSYDWTNAGVTFIYLNGPHPSENVKAPFSLEQAIDRCTEWLSRPSNMTQSSMFPYFFFDVNDDCIGDRNNSCH